MCIDHLVGRKVGHWDTAIRELTAKTLHKLTGREPAYVVAEIMPKLIEKTASIDVNQRHGAVLAIGEIVLMLKQLEIFEETRYIDDNLMQPLNVLVSSFQKRDQFKGLSGEMMFQSCCDFIRNCSAAKLPATTECIGKNAANKYFYFANELMVLLKFLFSIMAIGAGRMP